MDYGEIIKKAGLKATPQRKIVYELMTKLGHSSINEIITKAQQHHSEFTVSTVYRILDSFCNVGLLSKMSHPNGKCFYDITPTEHHHLLVNDDVIDYIDPELTDLIKKHLKGDLFDHFDVEKISVQIFVNKK